MEQDQVQVKREVARKLAPQGVTILVVQRTRLHNEVGAVIDLYTLRTDEKGDITFHYITKRVADLLGYELNGSEQLILRGTFHPTELIEYLGQVTWDDAKAYTVIAI